MRIFKFTTSAAPESFYRCFISVASFFLGNAGANETHAADEAAQWKALRAVDFMARLKPRPSTAVLRR
jgi:hypothetical protein